MITKEEEKQIELKRNIVAQAIQEISFDRLYKQGKIKNWQKNEQMYYGVKQVSDEARANVDLARMQEFVHTLLSKIKNPLVFKFRKRKEAQLQRVQNLNALREYDRQIDNWDIKDLAGKKQCIIYGRAVYFYHADSENGYQAHLENVDVHDFLIDPSTGGIDIEKADNLGRYGIVKTREELEAGQKNGTYIDSEVRQLLEGVGNNTEKSQEELNKDVRKRAQNTIGDKEIQKADKFKFWEWYTTYKGIKYYLLMQENRRCIRLEKLTDLFSPTKQFPKGAWPCWTYAAFIDLTEFWTPSYCDYIREMFMAQNVSINQMLDNAEEYNKPQKVINSVVIENLSELKYKTGKRNNIYTKGDFDASRVIQVLRPGSIDTPMRVFEALESIQEKALGVSAAAKGVGQEDKVAIYKGNQEAAADRFGLLNITYSFGYARFGRLYEIGARDNLTKKVAIDIMGPDGIETKEISKRDIFKRGDEFGLMTDASNAEDLASEITQKVKIDFLNSEAQAVKGVGKVYNPMLNPKKVLEIKAKISGFSDDEIKDLMDTDNFGTQKIMSEAARDIESIMDGEQILPNEIANTSYMQRLVDYGKDHNEDMTDKQKTDLVAYINSIQQIIMRNMSRSLAQENLNQSSNQPLPTSVDGSAVAGLPIIPGQ